VTDLAKNTTSKDVNLQDIMSAAPAASVPVAAAPNQGVVQASAQVPQSPPSYASSAFESKPFAQPTYEQKPPSFLPGSVNRQLLNTTRAALDYRIDQVGPSGVGKVEVWMTADQGHSWQRLSEDKNRRSPTEFDLPGEGLFGIRVVVTNGNGFGGRPPVPGDQPHCWIEVDTAAPIVQLREVERITNGNSVDIRWTATDKNLGTEPVNLYYATRKDGQWLPLASHLKNDGLYRWTFPRDAGGQFFIRAEVIDLAGNVTRCESSTAIALDMTEPRASVVGVTGVRGVATPGHGN
jgi:hypothetical protein